VETSARSVDPLLPVSSFRSKRVFDVTAAAIGLVVFMVPLSLIALGIKAGSRGPVFYRGVRIGRFGRPFRIYKFRTMVPDAERRGTATGHNDARITTAGRWLRRYKLDELPQLINVLKGEMSLVGPRPEVEEHIAVYSAEEQLILTAIPGITDLSSLRFVRLGELLGTDDPNKVFIEHYRAEKNRLRLEYVRTRSFLLDLKIIFQTLWAITGRRGDMTRAR
jgi:lipopolysaccharide/colanic/teichoic acid biosynthesis glycosyltransferase